MTTTTTTFSGTNATPRVVMTPDPFLKHTTPKEGYKHPQEDIALHITSPSSAPMIVRVSSSSAPPFLGCSTRLFFPADPSSSSSSALKRNSLEFTSNHFFGTHRGGGSIPSHPAHSPPHLQLQQQQTQMTNTLQDNEQRLHLVGLVPRGYTQGTPCPVIKPVSVRTLNETTNDVVARNDINNRLSTWNLKESTAITTTHTYSTTIATTHTDTATIIPCKIPGQGMATASVTPNSPEEVHKLLTPLTHRHHVTCTCISPVNMNNVIYQSAYPTDSICSLSSAPRVGVCINDKIPTFSSIVLPTGSVNHVHNVDTETGSSIHVYEVDAETESGMHEYDDIDDATDATVRRTRAKRKYVYNPKPIMKRPSNAQLQKKGRDEAYWRHREYNNAAARRSRTNRRAQEIETMERTRLLTEENQRLVDRANELSEENRGLVNRVKELEKVNEELKCLVWRGEKVISTTNM